MLISRVIEVEEGDTVQAVRGFLGKLLEEGIAERLFAPVEMVIGEPSRPEVVGLPQSVAHINPLLPLMTDNAAIALRQAMQQEPAAKFAAVLRPCEVRAVIELAKREQIRLDNLILIGLDCLSTYDTDFYREVSASHPDDPHWLLHESLRFAGKGQIAPYRYREACQFCDRPAPDYTAVDILLGVIGVDARQKVLVVAHERDDVKYKLARLTDRLATEREAVEREVAVFTLSQRRKEAADRKLDQMGLKGGSLAGIMGHMARCNLCGDCLDACPLVDEDLRASLSQGQASFLAAFVKQSQRFMSCAACGMCEAHCPEGIPLTAIARALSLPMREHAHYVAGRDPAEPLPWKS